MMTGEYYFNNIDSYLAFGVVFKKGAYSELLSIPGAWPNETRKIALPIVIAADNEADFWVKYNAFRALLTSGEVFTLHSYNLHRRFKLSYESISNFTMLTRITGGNKVYCDFVLNLEDDYPDVKSFTRVGTSFSRIYTSFSLADAIDLANSDEAFTDEKNSQIITFGALPVKRVGDADYLLTASASSGLPVSYSSSNPALASSSGQYLKILGIGTVEITASQGGNNLYLPADSVQRTLTILEQAIVPNILFPYSLPIAFK